LGWKPRMHGTDTYHHIYAWGNDRHPVFKKSVHYQKYLLLLGKYSKAFAVDIINRKPPCYVLLLKKRSENVGPERLC